jgi:hypothetical protein
MVLHNEGMLVTVAEVRDTPEDQTSYLTGSSRLGFAQINRKAKEGYPGDWTGDGRVNSGDKLDIAPY